MITSFLGVLGYGGRGLYRKLRGETRVSSDGLHMHYDVLAQHSRAEGAANPCLPTSLFVESDEENSMADDVARKDESCLFMRGVLWLRSCQWTRSGRSGLRPMLGHW
jgi:hypothetical protein